MPSFDSSRHGRMTVRHWTTTTLQVNFDGKIGLELDRNDAMILASYLNEVAYETAPDDESRSSGRQRPSSLPRLPESARRIRRKAPVQPQSTEEQGNG